MRMEVVLPGINQLGGAQTVGATDTSVKEVQPLSIEAALGAKGQQDSPADGVKATEETHLASQTDEDGRNQQEQKRSFAALSRRRRPDPYTGDLLSIRAGHDPDLALEPRLSLVAMGEHRSAKEQLQRAMNDIFARPTGATASVALPPPPPEIRERPEYKAEQRLVAEPAVEMSADEVADAE